MFLGYCSFFSKETNLIFQGTLIHEHCHWLKEVGEVVTFSNILDAKTQFCFTKDDLIPHLQSPPKEPCELAQGKLQFGVGVVHVQSVPTLG